MVKVTLSSSDITKSHGKSSKIHVVTQTRNRSPDVEYFNCMSEQRGHSKKSILLGLLYAGNVCMQPVAKMVPLPAKSSLHAEVYMNVFSMAKS